MKHRTSQALLLIIGLFVGPLAVLIAQLWLKLARLIGAVMSRFDELREGQAVTFEKGQGPKGPRGENVKLA